jgi:hypothetical protein
MISAQLSDNQKFLLREASRIYHEVLDTCLKGILYKGGMHWKKSKGKDYLFRSTDRFGYGKGLGARSPETERQLREFRQAKTTIKDDLSELKGRLKSHAALCKAASIHRVPKVVAGILRHLNQHRFLGNSGMVIGTYALYAYEAASGVFLNNTLLDNQIPPKLTLYFQKHIDRNGFLQMLRKTDRSFEMSSSRGFRAVNRNGHIIELTRPGRSHKISSNIIEPDTISDLDTRSVPDLKWLLAGPIFSQVVIDTDGNPARMAVPDPRGFTVHKLWLSERPSRELKRKQRDRIQGRAVARLIVQHLTGYRFTITELRMLPEDVLEECKQWLSDVSALPS